MVMVKAFSYGLGTYEVAEVLEKEGVDYLGVANILEGIEIRKAGVKAPIMVMNPEAASFNLMVEHNLSPVLFSSKNISLFAKEVQKAEYSSPFNIHIKIDTGMHRLGATPDELPELISTIKKECNWLKIESLFSHLASTDEPKDDEFTHGQVSDFKKYALYFSKHFNYNINLHILNTNGIIRFSEYAFNMVRLGIGLYGICADEETQKKLNVVSTLKTKISHIIKVKKGDSIGYNRIGKAEKDKTIATIPMGYADGFNRLLSNGKWEVLINNKKAPIIGNISMDMTMVDVSNIDCELGNEVVVFGAKNTISEMASRINTIPYELFTIISPRVKRVFYTK